MDIERLIDRAEGDVDRALLEETVCGGLFSSGYFHDGPLVRHLRYDESIDYVFQNLTK